MKPICVGCERFMRCKKNGYYFIEGAPWGDWDGNQGKGSVGWVPYKVWVGDLWECPTCGHQLVVGTGRQPVTEHYQSRFGAIIDHTNASRLLVKDC